jgi:hypothetical protein
MIAATTTWDLRVVSAFNAASVISYVPRWTSIEFSDQLNEVGSARVVHDFNDPWFASFEAETGQSLLTGPYSLQILRNGSPVFTFLIEDVQVDRAGQTQPVTISGRGIAATLEWAIVLPENFTGSARVGTTTSIRPTYFDRLFPGYHNVVRCATTTNLSASYTNGYSSSLPGVGAQLTATSNGKLSGIDGITDLSVGDNVLVKNQTNTAHNGVYWIADVGATSRPWMLQRVATHDGSPVKDLEVGRRIFVQEGNNGYKAYALTPASTITSPTQVGSVGLSYNEILPATGTYTGLGAFYILFHEAQSGYEHYTTETINWGQQNQSAGRGADLAVSFPLTLDSTFEASLGKTDSKSKIVQDGGFFTVPVGKTLLEVIKQVADQTKTDWHVSATGQISMVVQPFTRNGVINSVPFGTDRTTGSSAKLFSLPMLSSVETKTSATALRTVVYGSDARQIDRLISSSASVYGIRESYFENTSDDAPAVSNITNTGLRTVEGGKIQLTTTFSEREGFVAFQDFNVGDKVLLEISVGTYSQRIISAISAAISSSNEPTVEITFGDIFPNTAENLQDAAGFGSLNAATLATFSGQPANVFLQAPTSKSVVPSVSGMSNRAVVSWDATDAGRVSQYEVAVYREEEVLVGSTWTKVSKTITTIQRDSNVALVTTSSAHGYSAGNLVYVNCFSDHTFTAFAVPILAVTSSVGFAYANVGPDITITSASVATVTKVVELTSTIVDGSNDTASVENLSAPGRNYSAMITPYNEYGIAGQSSDPIAFTASTSPYQLLDASIQSSSYSAGSTGWQIAAAGAAEFNSVSINGGSLDIGGFDSTSFHVRSDGAMWLGASTLASAPFFVNATGSMYAISGKIAGFDLFNEYMSTGASFLGNMHFGNLSAVGIGNGLDGSQLAGLYIIGPESGALGNKALLTFDNLTMRNGSNEITKVHPDGIQYLANTRNEKFRFRWESGTGRLWCDIELANGTVIEYCIATCGEVTTTTTTTATTTPAPGPTTTTTTTTTTATPYRICTGSDLGFYGCNNIGDCKQGAQGPTCDPNTTTTTTTAAPPPTTTAAPPPTTTAAPPTTAAPTTTPAPAVDCNSGYSCVYVGNRCPGGSGPISCGTYTCTKSGCPTYSYCAGPGCL